MAKQPTQRVPLQKKVVKKKGGILELAFPETTNLVIIGVGILVIILGYIIMAMGDATSSLSVTVAPIVLVIGYCVIIPVGILYRKRTAANE